MTEQIRERNGELMPRAPRPTALWFGLFGAPGAWTVMFMVSYGMSAHFCYPLDTPLPTSTFGGLRAVLGAVILAAAIVGAAAAIIALKSWRATSNDAAGIGRALEMREGRPHWMALAGVLVSVLFLFLILLSGVPVLLVPPCSYGA